MDDIGAEREGEFLPQESGNDDGVTLAFITNKTAEKLLRKTRWPQETIDSPPDAVTPVPAPAPSVPVPTVVDMAGAARILGISRTTLDRKVSEAPPSLPGSPSVTLTNKKRSYRWETSTIWDWSRAYTAWKMKKPQEVTSKPGRPKPRGVLHNNVVDWNAEGRGKKP